jgi:acetyl-CoA carboxylase biotin carboxyl carrier protein
MDGNRHSYKESLSVEEQPSSDEISVEQLERLVHLLDESDVSEIEVKRVSLGTRLMLRKAKVSDGSNVAAAVAHAAIVEEPAPPVDTKHAVVAPLVGIFHAWAKPKGSPLVAVGDVVKVGQRVGTIQSLNVLNEVETQVAGRVVEIFVRDGQPVEYGQPLMTIDSAEEA